MKALIVFEARQGRLLDTAAELLGFAEGLDAEPVGLLASASEVLPPFGGKLFQAELGEGLPEAHLGGVLAAVQQESPDLIVLPHSAYGWDLAPRLAARLGWPLFSEVSALVDGAFELGACNGKMRRRVKPLGGKAIVTVQAGAFPPCAGGQPQVQPLGAATEAKGEFLGYGAAEAKAVDLGRAEVIVSAGRGLGKKDNLALVEALAKALGGEVGATRPVVDAGWIEHSRQVGSTGQTVAPKLYVACGISGAIQHLAGMKKSEFIVAINKDKEAPISEVADVLVVADVLQFLPVLTARIAK